MKKARFTKKLKKLVFFFSLFSFSRRRRGCKKKKKNIFASFSPHQPPPTLFRTLTISFLFPFSSSKHSQLLLLLLLPGLWSQIKRAPKAKRVRRVYEVPGPAAPGAVPLDERAGQIFRYFRQYNYTVAKPGSAAVSSSSSGSGGGGNDDGPSTSSSSDQQSTDVIRFVGRYAASRGQAAALVFYVFCGLASTALVLSIAAPVAGHGEWWYALTALSPLAGLYYWQRGERDEEFLVKMTTADDDSVTDISVEGDAEEADRMAKTLGLTEKGKVYVKGLLG